MQPKIVGTSVKEYLLLGHKRPVTLSEKLDIYVPMENQEYSKTSFVYSRTKTLNKIPLPCRHSPTISTFKKPNGISL